MANGSGVGVTVRALWTGLLGTNSRLKNRSLMYLQRFACCASRRFALGLLAGFIFTNDGLVNDGNAQEGSGVKIGLTLTPSKPADKPSDTKGKADAKPAEKSKAAEGGSSSAVDANAQSDGPKAKSESPFVLSAFKLAPDESSRTKRSSSDVKTSGSVLTLETPPAPTPKATTSTKAQMPPTAATPDAEKPEKLPAEGSKTKDIKPLKIKERKELSDNEDAEGTECPGGAESAKKLPVLPDDVPLEQEEHPYDAPAAESTSNKPDRPVTKPSLSNRPAPLSGEQLRLRAEINQLLRYYMQHPETIARRSPWAVMHAILPYGVEAELSAGNRRVNAIGWMSYNGLCKTQRIFQPTKSGFRTNLGPGVQGHEGQYLAILAQSKVAPTYPLKVGNRTYSVNDLVRYEMATCREKSELTFKLIGLSYYLDQDQQWRDNQGGSWSLEKLVAEELEQTDRRCCMRRYSSPNGAHLFAAAA